MSKEQVTEHQAHEDANAPQADARGDVAGLPPNLYQQAVRLGPGDSEQLAYLLTQFEMFAPQILALVSAQVGLSTVNAAKQRLAQHNTGTHATGRDQTQIRQMGEDAYANPHGSAQVEVSAQQHQSTMIEFEEVNSGPNHRAVVSEKEHAALKSVGGSETVATPAWITSARKYNAAHAHLSAEFNTATNGACLAMSGDDGELDPKLVAEWQTKHGLEADGKVGPRTVAEARKHTDDGDVEKPAAAPAPEAPPV